MNTNTTTDTRCNNAFGAEGFAPMVFIIVSNQLNRFIRLHNVAVNECRPTTGVCQNGGQCTDLERGYSCICTDGYTGTNCEIQGIIG